MLKMTKGKCPHCGKTIVINTNYGATIVEVDDTKY